MILIEENFNQVQTLNESVNGEKKLYLSGVFMQWGTKNRNGRIYEETDLTSAADMINEAAQNGRHILSELDHPSTLEIKLENVAMRLMEAKMDGKNVMCKAEVLSTPKGKILSSLMESGVQVGVSSRGSGSVNESTGKVNNYKFLTVDVVASPSAQDAYPETLREQMEMYGRGEMITDLSEAAVHDPLAQKYFEIEMRKFINSLRG